VSAASQPLPDPPQGLPARPVVRRARNTLPPKAALAALRVDAAGHVVEGPVGYYWYGDAVALVTEGEHGAEYLLGGASVPHGAVVALAAVADAKRWRAERGGGGSGGSGGSEAPSVDWAARAWAMDRHESALVEHAARRLGDAASWGVYKVALGEASAALARRG
jgi:hypothetical protein